MNYKKVKLKDMLQVNGWTNCFFFRALIQKVRCLLFSNIFRKKNLHYHIKKSNGLVVVYNKHCFMCEYMNYQLRKQLVLVLLEIIFVKK